MPCGVRRISPPPPVNRRSGPTEIHRKRAFWLPVVLPPDGPTGRLAGSPLIRRTTLSPAVPSPQRPFVQRPFPRRPFGLAIFEGLVVRRPSLRTGPWHDPRPERDIRSRARVAIAGPTRAGAGRVPHVGIRGVFAPETSHGPRAANRPGRMSRDASISLRISTILLRYCRIQAGSCLVWQACWLRSETPEPACCCASSSEHPHDNRCYEHECSARGQEVNIADKCHAVASRSLSTRK